MSWKKTTTLDFSVLEEKFRQGDYESALEAFYLAYRYEVIAPAWAVEFIALRIGGWLGAEKRTLDEAFELKRPKSWSINRKRSENTIAAKIFLEVEALRKKGNRRDTGLYEAVGEKFGIGKTKVFELYDLVRKSRTKKPGVKINVTHTSGDS